MMFSETPTVPQVSVPSDERIRTRTRAAVECCRIQDADVVVAQKHMLKLRIEPVQRFSKGGVQRVDRSVAFGGGMLFGSARIQYLDGGFGAHVACEKLFNDDAKSDPFKRGLKMPHRLLRKQQERSIRAFKLIAEPLRLFEPFVNALHLQASVCPDADNRFQSFR